jgi:hypothetical protein
VQGVVNHAQLANILLQVVLLLKACAKIAAPDIFQVHQGVQPSAPSALLAQPGRALDLLPVQSAMQI